MKSHRKIATDEQIQQHSLPGINMAGKEAPGKECECAEESADAKEQPHRPQEPPVRDDAGE